ncbi:TerD family protein [Streptomyces ramulosus]|uniref:TerD family protein n=1 Tax=Streptomyces sp. NPDC000404 TaxID=3154253 RepID=UPI0031EC7193
MPARPRADRPALRGCPPPAVRLTSRAGKGSRPRAEPFRASGETESDGRTSPVSTLNKGIEKAEVTLKWDPSPAGEPDNDLDLIAATYEADTPTDKPVYLVHFDSRSPDGTITLNRDSRTGQGFGSDEVMTLELERLAERYTKVVVGVAIQQGGGRKTFGEVPNTEVQIREGYTELVQDDFASVAPSTASVVAVFTRDTDGEWRLRKGLRGFDADPNAFTALMGS